MARGVLTDEIAAAFIYEDLQEFQAQDKDCENYLEETRRNPESSPFVIQENLLHRKKGDSLKMVIPKRLRKFLLEMNHDNILYGGHLGIKKTLMKLNKYWWQTNKNKLLSISILARCARVPKSPRVFLMEF